MELFSSSEKAPDPIYTVPSGQCTACNRPLDKSYTLMLEKMVYQYGVPTAVVICLCGGVNVLGGTHALEAMDRRVERHASPAS